MAPDQTPRGPLRVTQSKTDFEEHVCFSASRRFAEFNFMQSKATGSDGLLCVIHHLASSFIYSHDVFLGYACTSLYAAA